MKTIYTLQLRFVLKNDRSRQSTGTGMEEREKFFERFKNCTGETIKHFQNTDIQPLLKMIKNARNIYVYGSCWAPDVAGKIWIGYFSAVISR